LGKSRHKGGQEGGNLPQKKNAQSFEMQDKKYSQRMKKRKEGAKTTVSSVLHKGEHQGGRRRYKGTKGRRLGREEKKLVKGVQLESYL